jgi:hypothetical protein
MDSYAVKSDLSDWLPATVNMPQDPTSLLRSATFIVAQACNRNPYTDTPTDPAKAALRDATCAQVQSWLTLGIAPAAVGLDSAPVKKSTILGADVEHDTTGQVAALAEAAKHLAPEAYTILYTAGLLWLPVPLGTDPTDPLPQWGQGRRWWPYPEPMSGEFEWPYFGVEFP